MKISKRNAAALTLALIAIAFMAGWYFRGNSAPEPFRVETERRLTAEPLVIDQSSREIPLIDINTADSETLQTLPGIGPKRAEDIIAYRESHGAFRIVEELTDVPGIGEETLSGLIEYVTTGEVQEGGAP